MIGTNPFNLLALFIRLSINLISVENLITLLFKNQIASFSFSRIFGSFFFLNSNRVFINSFGFPVSNQLNSKDFILFFFKFHLNHKLHPE